MIVGVSLGLVDYFRRKKKKEIKGVFLSLVIQRLGEIAVILCLPLPGSSLLQPPCVGRGAACNLCRVFAPFTGCHPLLMEPYTQLRARPLGLLEHTV